MHPSLSSHLHEECTEFIEGLTKCHKEHPYSKFFGKCNDAKLKMMKCLTEEDSRRRKENRKVAMENNEKSKRFRASLKSSE